MIIPIRCFNCGYVLADKWRFYEERVKRLRIERGDTAGPILIDGSVKPDMITPELQACNEIGITRYCCRKTILTHRDLLEKI
jgi:DNA-directed RNA polymerase I, II, and III subunit RPABC5